MSLDINQMTKEQLIALDGINEQLADEIIARRRLAAFTSVNDLVRLPGMSLANLERLKEQGVACASPVANQAATFACRSCGRSLPIAERETSSPSLQDICITCFFNVIFPCNPLEGA